MTELAEATKIAEALLILEELGMPRAQQNERSALCLLALLHLSEGMSWRDAKNPLMGITPNKKAYLERRPTLAARYAKERDMQKLPVQLASGETIRLTPGRHSELIKAIIEEFASRFVPGGVLSYAGDTGEKWGVLR